MNGLHDFDLLTLAEVAALLHCSKAHVCKAVELSGRADLRFLVQEPFGFRDFNDQLRAKVKAPIPRNPAEPSFA